MAIKKIKIALVAGHTTWLRYDRGAQRYVIEGIANRQQMLACAEELKKYPQFDVRVEPDGLDLDGEIAWVNKINPHLAIGFHNNAGGADYWLALCSVTGSTDDFARIAEKHFKALGWKSAGILKRKNGSGGNYYGFIRLTRCATIIFETAFVDNLTSAKKIDTPEENAAIGKLYAKAVREYYKVNAPVKIAKPKKALLPQGYTYALPTKEAFPMGVDYNRWVDVKKWQGFLNWMGFKTTIDGVFGPETELATKLAQRALKCKDIDGVVGAETVGLARKYKKR